MKDKRWVNNSEGPKLINKAELEEYLSQGFVEGKSSKPTIKMPPPDQRPIDKYKLLRPMCRNSLCKNQLSYEQYQRRATSCSKACSNKTRNLKLP